jgi:hypothetical protein
MFQLLEQVVRTGQPVVIYCARPRGVTGKPTGTGTYTGESCRAWVTVPLPWQRAVSGGDSEHDRVLEGEVLRRL